MKIAIVKLGTLCLIDGVLVHSAEAVERLTDLKDAMNVVFGRLKLSKISAFDLNESATGFVGVTPSGGSRLAQAGTQKHAEIVVEAFNSTLDRYQAACKKSDSMPKSAVDSAMLALNRAIHSTLGDSGEVDIIMDAEQALVLKCRDPATVREVIAIETQFIRVKGAVATGSRLLKFTQQLELPGLETMVDTVITIADPLVPEFIHKMSLGEAQRAWCGHPEMSCLVEIREGVIARVVGELEIHSK